MAAAYAALMSLMHTSKRILHPSNQWLRIHRNMIGFLLQKAHVLQEFLEDYSHRGDEEMAGIESQIADMAYAAEDVIESHVLDQILARSTGSEAKSSTSFSGYIQKLIEEMEYLIETKVIRIKETIGDFKEDRTFLNFSPAASPRLAPNEQNTLVGSDEKLNEIMDILTGQQLNRQIITIVGMGGIGKTTLAKNVYEHPHIKHHFHIRAWATISQKYSARKIISEMLAEIGQSRPESLSSDDQLGEQLYKSLCGRRYLIVMDDFWSIEAWDEIKRFFPDHHNGSQIMITTRLRNVSAHLSSCRPFEMEFLDANRSWELMSKKVFGNQDCPPELEELGKTIARNCGGLPLAIVVIGGLLAKSDKTTASWTYVAENLNSVVNSEDNEKCLKILSLSYNNLPIHLKPCFLHMATFQEKYIINIGWLIESWISEGFLKPIRGKSLEEAADEYVTDLIDRNLIFIRKGDIQRRSVICDIHDLLMDLCLREAQKSNWYSVIDVQNHDIPSEIKFSYRQAPLKPKRSIPHALHLLGPASLTRSSISGLDSTLSYPTNLRLLRLLVMTDTTLPNEILQLINLRFMSFEGHLAWNSISRFTSSISLFWNLQTLQILNDSEELILLPPEIWCLPHLRNLQVYSCVLPDPPPCRDMDKHDSHILENLHTLSLVQFFRCTEEVCRRLQNLKELLVTYDPLSPGVEWSFFHLHNLVHLHKLQSLTFVAYSPNFPKYLSFPLSLKELRLSDCRLPWEDMKIVGSLPNLEALELWPYACEGLTWCPIEEGQFVKLKVLVIEETDLLHWRADKTHFPILEHLILRKLNLEEFPQDFGEHPTLETIEVVYCSNSTEAWAEQIREEQESFGNEDFRVKARETKE